MTGCFLRKLQRRSERRRLANGMPLTAVSADLLTQNLPDSINRRRLGIDRAAGFRVPVEVRGPQGDTRDECGNEGKDGLGGVQNVVKILTCNHDRFAELHQNEQTAAFRHMFARNGVVGGAGVPQQRRNQTDVATGHERSASYGAFQPKVTLSQKFDANQLGYLTYSTGFRSGGFNGIGQLDPFKKELLRNLEAGYKSTWFDQRLMVNVAAFLERDTGFQFFYVDLAAGGAQVIANLNSVQLYGTEIQTQGVIAPGWTAYLNIGLLESRIRDLDANLGVPAAVGNKTPKTVPDKFNLGTQKEWTFDQYKAGLRIDFEYRGKKYWDTSNVDVMNPVKLLSARASLKRGSWELAVSGRNLLNQYYFEDFNSKAFTGLPNNIGWPTQPRSLEATLRHDF
jgi:outer membrane receptor protein involved in Fe transport